MKRIKMVLYGEPGVGKSVFASKSLKPFFICTDGNYEWLEEFGAKPEDHVNVTSWSEAKAIFEKVSTSAFDKYETIVVDLTEDLFKWCEQEYCVRNKIEHLSDLGYGKAYDTTRNEFFIEICKLFAFDKNIILLMHGVQYTVKDRRGVEHTKYSPTTRIPDKVMDMIEGRTRYFLRCYLKDEELEDGTLLKKRYLSLIPKPDEFGIVRGIDENKVPHDIPLEWSEFVKAIGFDTTVSVKTAKEKIEEKSVAKVEEKIEKQPEPKVEEKSEPEVEQLTIDIPAEMKMPEVAKETIEETVKKPEPVVEKPAEPAKTISNDDRIAAIKAKLAALSKK